jgi:riboflavin kinase/FMN adenylyltransferase
MRGEVVHGDKRGRDLGYPTANLIPQETLVCPGHGVYAARVGDVCAAVNVGVRPTFGMGLALLVEAFLIDWEGDLYGTEMRLDFIQRLRGERRFDSAQELIDQMAIDVAQARELCR